MDIDACSTITKCHRRLGRVEIMVYSRTIICDFLYGAPHIPAVSVTVGGVAAGVGEVPRAGVF